MGMEITILVAGLITLESLQDVYMANGLNAEFRAKMKSGMSKIAGRICTDDDLDLFIDSFVDNTFQKLDLLKVMIWSNTGLFLINSIEDSVQDKLGGLKTGFLNKIKDFKIPSKFSKVGGTAKVVTDLVVQKNQQVKKMSDYMYQATSVGSTMLNSANTGSLSKMYQKNNLNKLSPKEQASYQVVKEMLNTVQASR